MTARTSNRNVQNGRTHRVVPPADTTAERLLVGSVFHSPYLLPNVLDVLRAEQIVSAGYRLVFDAILAVAERGDEVTFVSVRNELAASGKLDTIGGEVTLQDIVGAVPHGEHAVSYAKQVRDTWVKREAFKGLREVEMLLSNPGASADEVGEHLEWLLGRLVGNGAAQSQALESFTIAELQERFPRLHEPLIDGLLRRGETMNIISVSKIGKSWLAYSLLLCVVTGREWLGRFRTAKGKVLLIDNELHKPTLASRIRTVAEAMGIQPDEYADQIVIWPVRGKLKNIFDLKQRFDRIRPGEFALIVVDAKYRMLPAGKSESDNAAETAFYNEVDRIAEQTQAAVVLIHHSSKGDQSGKRVTDVGSGAGAQSRAADCHVILREHEDDEAIVLEAAVRSFAPVEPLGLRWEFPLWVPADDLDPTRLKGKASINEEHQQELDSEADDAVLRNSATWITKTALLECVPFGEGRLKRALARLQSARQLDRQEITKRGNKCFEYRKSINAFTPPDDTSPDRET